MARFGGNLKRKEKINGRFGDALSAMYMAVCVLRKFDANGRKKEEEPVVEHALKEIFIKAQIAIDGLYQNLFGGFGRFILLPFSLWSRFNAFVLAASDNLGHKVVKDFIKNSPLRESLTEGIFVSKDKDDNLGRLEYAMQMQEKSQFVVDKIKNAIRNKTLPRKKVEDLIELAQEKSIISLGEKYLLKDAVAALLDAVQVDEYTLEEYKKL